VSYSVGQVADLAGVTIRTLHHYDEIDLLSPSGRSAAGYRIYEEPDLERLQQILFYRDSGSPWKRSPLSWTTLAPTRLVT
jgi:DNA-binding transcriptional MerR regulator